MHTWVAMQQSANIIAIKYIISSKITAKTDFFFFSYIQLFDIVQAFC